MSKQKDEDAIVRELRQVKRVLAVMLLKAGCPQSELAIALEMDPAQLSRELPARKFKRFKATQE